MMRDGMSRLVRRTWAASKRHKRLQQHLWVWTCYRNYVRHVRNIEPRSTPAMRLGILSRKVDFDDLFVWQEPYVAELLAV